MRAHRMVWAGLALLAVMVSCSAPTAATSVPPTASSAPPPTATTAPTAKPIVPSVQVTGDQQVVFDWATEHCGNGEHPDLPVRAFRDATGMIQMTIPAPTNYRLVGPDLNSLKPDCRPVLVSPEDRDPSHYNTNDWLGATYTLDGKTVYAVVHDEYHGDTDGSIWQAHSDFSSTQGFHAWRYLAWNGSTYVDMTYDAAHQRWQGPQPLCQISDRFEHPDRSCEPSRTWVSPIDGTVDVNGRAYDADPNGGNGVSVAIYKNDGQLWTATIENGDSTGQTFDLQVPVQVGDMLHFRVNARGDTSFDTTFFDPGINVGPAPCPSGNHNLCTLISLTYAVSTDGGQTYTQPAAPNHLLANPPHTYDPNAMEAIWQPSNIVKNPNDGYYYMLVQRDEHGAGVGGDVQGTCALRTQTLDDPTSWRAWDGTGFNMAFVDPYTQTTALPSDHTCQLVSEGEIGALSYGLSYSTYYKKFVAVGASGAPTPGFYYSLSDDLVHWTSKQLIMPAAMGFANGGQFPYFAYPSLIDPNSPSANFDVIGQTPYMYFSRFNSVSPVLDVDLLRVPLQFGK